MQNIWKSVQVSLCEVHNISNSTIVGKSVKKMEFIKTYKNVEDKRSLASQHDQSQSQQNASKRGTVIVGETFLLIDLYTKH